MSDIRSGDVVVCVAGYHLPQDPQQGAVCRVFGVESHLSWRCRALHLDGYDPGEWYTGYAERNFRKLPEADAEFTADLKARIRRHDTVPA